MKYRVQLQTLDMEARGKEVESISYQILAEFSYCVIYNEPWQIG